MSKERFGFVGGGNMGEALIKGLMESGKTAPEEVWVFDPDPGRTRYLNETYGIRIGKDNGETVQAGSIVVLAVKPQFMDAALTEVRSGLNAGQMVVSVAAGVTLNTMESALPPYTPVIRAMPNTPALVMSGATAMAAGTHAGPEHLEKARILFESVGLVIETQEHLLDVVTGLSGSGPAYVFIFLEALADGAVRLGLPRKQAELLASQTVMGAARLALESPNHTGALKDMVMSPGGTTAAGIHALEKGAFRGLVMDAVAAAAKRAWELGHK